MLCRSDSEEVIRCVHQPLLCYAFQNLRPRLIMTSSDVLSNDVFGKARRSISFAERWRGREGVMVFIDGDLIFDIFDI